MPHHTICLGAYAQATEPYEMVLNIQGVGMRRTILTPEEHAVMLGIVARMLALELATGKLWTTKERPE